MQRRERLRRTLECAELRLVIILLLGRHVDGA